MDENSYLPLIQKEWHGSLKSYAIGFIASLLLTGASFLLVLSKILVGRPLVYAVVGLGVVQAVVQLLFFLHLGKEARPKWELLVFFSMVGVLLIVVLGTLWIMYDLDSRMMVMEKTHD